MVLVIVLVVFTLIITWRGHFLGELQGRGASRRPDPRETERQDAEIAVITAQLSRVNEATGLKTGEEGRLSAPQANEAMKKWREEYVSPAPLRSFRLVRPAGRRPHEEGRRGQADPRPGRIFLHAHLQALINPAISRTNHYKNRMEQLQLDLTSAESQKKSRETVAPRSQEEGRDDRQPAEGNRAAQRGNRPPQTQYNDRKTKFNETRPRPSRKPPPKSKSTRRTKSRSTTRSASSSVSSRSSGEGDHQARDQFRAWQIIRPDVPNKVAFINIGSARARDPRLKFLVATAAFRASSSTRPRSSQKAWMTYCEVASSRATQGQAVVRGRRHRHPALPKDRPILVASSARTAAASAVFGR